MYRKLFTVVSVMVCLMFTACGNSSESNDAVEANGGVVVESVTSTEESETVVESETTVEESEPATETAVAVESEATTEKNTNIEINGGALTSELREYEAKYITYEPLEPTQMYVIQYSDMYTDLNASEGVLRMDGCLEEGAEILIDGKGTYNDVEYYRLARPEDSPNPYHLIIPASALSLEKPAEKPAEQQPQQPVVQQPQQPQQPADTTPNNAEEIVGEDVYAGLTEEEKAGLEQFLNGGSSNADLAEDPWAGTGVTKDFENRSIGGIEFSDPSLEDKIGSLTPDF